ncbi:hypothetical protein LPA49_22110, partial [Pseudoalteromonas sp. MB41]|nr:hypothetical protein [Pseudoalteromonas sp. MB41]
MSISYRFAKMNARVMENSQNFKNFFSKKRFNKFTDLMGFQIVKILVLKDEKRRFKDSNCIDNEGRYLGFQKANDAMLALTLGPILMGAVLTFMSIIFFGVWFYSQFTSTPEDFPFWFVLPAIGFNLFFLNFGPILARYILPRREVYFDRINQTVSFTWSVDNAQKNEHGHATFPFSDIEAFYAKA